MIKRQGSGARETFTVRKQSFGVGVERTFPVHSPKIERIEVAARGDVRRAKLYYLRDRVGRAVARARAPLDRGRRTRRSSRASRRALCRRTTRRAPARRSSRSRPPRRRPRPQPEAAEAEAARPSRRPRPSREPEAEPETPRADGRPPAEAGAPSRARGGRAARRRPGVVDRASGWPWRKGKEKRQHNSLIELVMIVAVALGLALGIQAFLVKPFRIPSESMVPTLEIGQRVLVDRVSFRFGDPDRGDIVVFKPPAGADTEHLRRAAIQRPVLPGADRGALGHELHQARRRPARRPPQGGGRRASTSTGKRQDEPFARLDANAASATCRGDHHPGRPVLHDGRQPRRVGGQPRMGPDAQEVDHREGLHDLLAAGANRPALGVVPPAPARFRRAPAYYGADSGDAGNRRHHAAAPETHAQA